MSGYQWQLILLLLKILMKFVLCIQKEGLEESMRGSEFFYDSVDALYYDLNKVSLSRAGSYIDSPKWLKNKKAAINPQYKKDDRCFQYAVTVALNYKKIKEDPQRISKIRSFIDQYNWKEIDFPSRSKDWKKIESNNESIALNILYVPHNTEKIRHAYKSKYNLNRKNQVTLLMITDGEKWHYLAVKSLSALFRGTTSNHKEEFYCLNCFQSCTTENKLKKHKKVCEGHDSCYVEMPEKDNKILKYNDVEKSMKVPFIIYADLQSLLEKINTCHNNPEKSSTTKINKHAPSGCPLFTYCSFDTTKNKLDYYRGENCVKNVWLDLREHSTKKINYEKKEMIPLTEEGKNWHNRQKVIYKKRIKNFIYICHIYKRIFSTDYNNKKYYKVKDHCHYTGEYRGDAHYICNLRYKISKESPVVFHNDSTYDYHFIIKELAEEFEGEFECLGENTEKYITFSVLIKKEITKKDKDGNKKITKISYKIKFIDTYRFMSNSLSSLVTTNLSEGLHNDRCTESKSYLESMAAKMKN